MRPAKHESTEATLREADMNALHLHLRRYGMLDIAHRHPRLFGRLMQAPLLNIDSITGRRQLPASAGTLLRSR
jgi:hypothetical protein